MKKTLVLILSILLVACASYKPITPTQSDVEKASTFSTGVTIDDLNQGKAIFETKCHKCHSLKRPFRKSGDEIEAALPKMAKRAKLDGHQEELVLNYLLAVNASPPTK